MFNPDRRPSDIDSVSSATSNATSRATTIPNSWSATTLQDKLKQLSQYNIRPVDDDDDHSSNSSDTPEGAMSVNSKNNDMQRNNIIQPNNMNAQNQQQPWVNPYWGPTSNSGTTTYPSDVNPSVNGVGVSTAQEHVKQLIPGSILINDQGEIDDAQWSKNSGLHSSTSSASFTPGGEYISDESGGAGGYLAPTHIQRRSAPASSGQTVQSGNRNSLTQSQQTPENMTNSTTQPWVNPYWPQKDQNNTDRSQSGNFKPNFENSSHLYVNTSPKTTIASDTWENPYWGDNNTINENSLSMKSSSSSSTVPYFYERIYPPPSPTSSLTNIQHEITPSMKKSDVHMQDDNDDLPYTFDNPNVVRYRAPYAAPNRTNKVFNSTPTILNAQYPLSSEPKLNTSGYSPTTNINTPSSLNNILSTLFPNANTYPSSSVHYDIPSLSNSATVLTESEIHRIHKALRLLETDPNAIPTVESYNHMTSSSSTIDQRSDPLSSITSSAQPHSSLLSRTVQFSSPKASLFSMPSYPGTTRKSLHQSTEQGKVALI
ncbi:unnamed protein product [Adineta ricciae]|uniref:Uncharacterized protein n=1 Tax=Adineta ricciae TaxID=249248 RepID=A0A814EQ85_ADIRI|nr:unnamed protein product [Adineta ricciae]CAF1544684.1 unnamed protein product [Adineta ricciae]